MGSEVEKPVTAEVPQPVADEGPKEGESPPSARPVKPKKPDVARHKVEVDEMHVKLKERKNNIDAINDKIRQMQSGGNRNPDNHLYDRLKKLRLDWDAALVSPIPLPTFGPVLIEAVHASWLSSCSKNVGHLLSVLSWGAIMLQQRLLTYPKAQRRWNCPPAGKEAWSARPAQGC